MEDFIIEARLMWFEIVRYLVLLLYFLNNSNYTGVM